MGIRVALRSGRRYETLAEPHARWLVTRSGSDAMFDRGGKSVWHVLAQGPDELVVYQRSVRTRTRDFRASLVIDTVGFCRL